MHQSTNRAFRLSQVDKLPVKLNPYLSFFPLIFFFFGWGVNWPDELNNKKIPAPLTFSLIEKENLSCPRNDVDPCDYATNGAFATGLISELNSIIMGCPTQNQCSPQCCESYINISLSKKFNINSNDLNPFIYCCSRTDCYAYSCGTLGQICNYADQVLQDSMLMYARDVAIANKPMCGNQPALIKDMYLYLNSFSSGCTLGGCYNCQIYLHVDYYSCNCTEE